MKKQERTIDIDLSDLRLFYNNYNKNELSSTLINYIDYEVTKGNGNEAITIHINTFFEVSDKQKENMKATIYHYYRYVIRDILHHQRYDDAKDIILGIVGVVVIVLADFSRILSTGFVTDLISIIGSFAILQALADIIFADASRRIKLKRTKELSNCKVDFYYDPDKGVLPDLPLADKC